MRAINDSAVVRQLQRPGYNDDIEYCGPLDGILTAMHGARNAASRETLSYLPLRRDDLS
jgi:hypothetical protein